MKLFTKIFKGRKREKCRHYIDHQPVWDGNYFTCVYCGVEFAQTKDQKNSLAKYY